MAWADHPRHQLLEGLLRRLASSPDAEAFTLRGGLRIRQLAGSPRPVLDADLLCALPFAPASVLRVLSAVLDAPVGDGVRFDADRLRVDPWFSAPGPGLRVEARGVAGSRSERLVVDLRFGLPEAPAAPFRAGGGWIVGLRPEAMIARKLRVLADLGADRWRPKDLWDLEVLLGADGVCRATLGAALEAAGAPAALPAWVERPTGRRRSRWAAFALYVGRPDLDATVAAVRDGLRRTHGR